MEIVNYVEGDDLFAMVSVSITDDFKSHVGTNLENFGYLK